MRFYILAPVILAVATLIAPALSAPIASTYLDPRADFDNDLEQRAFQPGHFDLEQRDFLPQLASREFQQDLFVRAFEEELQSRGLESRKIHIHISNGFKKFLHKVANVGKKIWDVAKKVVSKIPIPLPIRRREDAWILARDPGIDDELFARGHGDDLELQPRERLFMRTLVDALEMRAVEDIYGRDGMSSYEPRSFKYQARSDDELDLLARRMYDENDELDWA